eukprot:2448614-Prorocentrum_lima.AAC.1
MLDWEKAFDKLSHSMLLDSLRRLRVTDRLHAAIASLYHNPEFQVELNRELSQICTQRRGIRQGCPLSPYLFVA